MRYFLALNLYLTFLGPSVSLACTNDIDCNVGSKCVKPSGSWSVNGVCVAPPLGAPYTPPSFQPHRVSGCQFNTDCPTGSMCYVEQGQLYGVCAK